MNQTPLPNKALQLTSNSAFQFRFGSILASQLGAPAASEVLLAAAERQIRWAATRPPMQQRQAELLRRAFLVGAITDGLALIPMLIPAAARVLWGFSDPSGAYQFAMGYGASLMLGWTALLVWAYQRPIERRSVAALTLLVIYGLVLTEIVAVWSGHLEAWRMIPTWCLQAVLLSLFASAYHYPALKRWVAA